MVRLIPFFDRAIEARRRFRVGMSPLAHGVLFAPLEVSLSIGNEGVGVFCCDGFVASSLSEGIPIGVFGRVA